MTYKIGLLIDERRLEAIRGTPLEGRLRSMFGGEIKILEVDVDDDIAKRLLQEFPSARVDSRGFIEDLPVAFRRALFEAVAATKNAGREALEKTLQKLDEIKAAAAKEKEYVPPPA